jgi:hypothetical protein
MVGMIITEYFCTKLFGLVKGLEFQLIWYHCIPQMVGRKLNEYFCTTMFGLETRIRISADMVSGTAYLRWWVGS